MLKHLIGLILFSLCLPLVAKEAAPLEFKGLWEQGSVLFGKALPGSKVTVAGKSLLVTEKGEFVIGLGREAESPFELTLIMPDQQAMHLTYPVKKREYNIQRIEGVQQKHVTPPESVLARIKNEAAKVRQARDRVDPRQDFLEKFMWPLVGPITGVYGSQRVYNGVPKSPHYGVDIAAPVGAEVVAPAAGIITLAEPDLYYSGGTVILDHGHALSSTFIHLSKVLVKVGQKVKKGDVIAEVGATGRATGPHLDWRMNWYEHRVDPQLLMFDTPMPSQQ